MTGPVKTSPSGKFSWPSQLIQRRAGDAHAHVGAVGGDDAVVVLAVEEIDEALLLLADAFPRGDGIGVIEHAGAKDEVLVLAEAHLGVLGGGLGGELRAAPFELTFRSRAS